MRIFTGKRSNAPKQYLFFQSLRSMLQQEEADKEKFRRKNITQVHPAL